MYVSEHILLFTCMYDRRVHMPGVRALVMKHLCAPAHINVAEVNLNFRPAQLAPPATLDTLHWCEHYNCWVMGHKVRDKVTHPIPQSTALFGIGLQVKNVSKLRDHMGPPSKGPCGRLSVSSFRSKRYVTPYMQHRRRVTRTSSV